MREEEWEFWSARAYVCRMGAQTFIALRGVVTAQVYEALHLRMGVAPGIGTHTLVLDWPALLAATNISAVDAAIRGAPACLRGCGAAMTILVPRARLAWSQEHCRLMSTSGLYRRTSSLQEATAALALVA